jgi:23S rRNA (uracil1939-C5)-methyltransferase
METFELSLTGLAYGGEAFGRDAEGRMVFVAFTLPGERVVVETTEKHKRWSRAKLLEVLEASPDRIPPRCLHFTDCGGCHYQHMPYHEQTHAKHEILKDQLERIGGFHEPPVEATIQSPSPWNTRNHLQFSLTAEGQLGFNAAGSDRVVSIQECHLPEPVLAELWPRIEVEQIPGLDRIAIRRGSWGDQMIILHSDRHPEVELMVDLPASVVWLGPGGTAVLAGEGSLSFEILDRVFQVSADSFFQVHTSLTNELVQHSLKALQPQPGETVYDLYAGVGLFSAFFAEAGARVIAVEESPWACADFETNLNEFDNVELYEASVELALPSIHTQPDAVLVDPPRAGLTRDVREALIRLAPPRLIYVSCDPATLARDGKYLAQAGYHLNRCTPFDLFPQTFHIESLSVWRRE